MKAKPWMILLATSALALNSAHADDASESHAGEFTTEKGMIVCYNDTLMVDGKSRRSAICATNESKFFGGGEPKINIGVNNRRLIQALASQTSDPISVKYGKSVVTLQCSPIISEESEMEIGRNCIASADGVVGYTVRINFLGRK